MSLCSYSRLTKLRLCVGQCSEVLRKCRRFYSSAKSSLRYENDKSLMWSERPEILEGLSEALSVHQDFVTVEEEKSICKEIEPVLKRLRYEFDHWDNAIHGYRETERSRWNDSNKRIISRIQDFAFLPDSNKMSLVHILDLAEDGFIKPHVDSVRFCGDTIAGLSLSSDSVMRLVNEKDSTQVVDILLKQRSLYIIRGTARYDFAHEILSNDKSMFRNVPVRKTRRISVICRNEP